ncbi:hypothetical protein [Dyadobacter arcticus]|uniref:Lipocalin-like domain-containing protein n=1 Tax=Dyadobacter arcticus TaxID=1078754 RepID=A0ABX0UQ82_9BACT|nr:hypothetical protein [Dyadobacter arcticus]NIJ53835.1 hypothetical protein [Dyadobacter arcticus]
MKKIAFYAFILTCGLLNMGAGCAKESEKTPEPKLEYPSLIGKWKLFVGFSFGKKSLDEPWKQVFQMKRGSVSWEFLADGRMLSYTNTANPEVEAGNWTLEIKNMDGKDIALGFFKIYTPFTRANPGSEFIEPDGSIAYHLKTVTEDGVTFLYLTTKAYESYPYKYAYNEYRFEPEK